MFENIDFDIEYTNRMKGRVLNYIRWVVTK